MINTLYKTFQRWSEKGSVFIISDTHFEDADCKLMNPDWPSPEEQVKKIKELVHRNDTLIHLGDVVNPEYIKQIPGYKVLLLGNHDQSVKKFEPYFDEIYSGPLFIADRILLSHEPVYGLEQWCVNIHGHVHNGGSTKTHINLASDVCGYTPVNLGKMIKEGLLSETKDIHRVTVDEAIYRKKIAWMKDYTYTVTMSFDEKKIEEDGRFTMKDVDYSLTKYFGQYEEIEKHESESSNTLEFGIKKHDDFGALRACVMNAYCGDAKPYFIELVFHHIDTGMYEDLLDGYRKAGM